LNVNARGRSSASSSTSLTDGSSPINSPNVGSCLRDEGEAEGRASDQRKQGHAGLILTIFPK
jgi:hypothetical protein